MEFTPLSCLFILTYMQIYTYKYIHQQMHKFI